MKYAYIISTIIFLCCCRQKSDRPIIATVEEQPIYSQEVDCLIEQELYGTLQRIYFLRKAAADEVINQKLIDLEAKRMGITSRQLINRAIDAKISATNIERYIAQQHLNSSGIPVLNNGYRIVSPSTMEGKKLVTGEYKKYLKGQLIDSLRKKYKVALHLQPPKPPLVSLRNAPIIHYRGQADASVTVVEVTDFECDNCRTNFAIYKELFNTYKDSVRFAFTHFSGNVTLAAMAAEAAHRQGKFWLMHEAIFTAPQISATDTLTYVSMAGKIGLDIDRFKQDLQDTDLYASIQANIDFCRSKNLYATPTVIVNGTVVMDAFNKGSIQKVIDEKLLDAK